MQASASCLGQRAAPRTVSSSCRPVAVLPTRAAAPCVSAAHQSSTAARRPLAVSLRRRAVGRQATTTVCKAAAGGDTLVLGTSGQLAGRVVVQLLRAGGRVTAALDDAEQAAEALAFAKGLEIISATQAKQLSTVEVDPRDPEDLASALPARGRTRVVLCLSDVSGGRRPDQRVYSAVLSAISENAERISQLVVISPGGGGGTSLFGRTSGGSGTPRLAPLEQQAMKSASSVLLIRTASLVDDSKAGDAGLVAAGLGGIPASLALTRGQVADVVVAALGQGQAGKAVLEIGATDDAPERDAAEVLGEVLAGAYAEAEEEEEEAAPAPAPAKAGLFSFGTVKKQAAAAVEVEVEVADEEPAPGPAPARKQRPSGWFGTLRKRVPVVEEQEQEEELEEEEEVAPAKKAPAFAFSFGTKKKQAAVDAAEEEEETVQRAPVRRQLAAPARAAPPPPASAVKSRAQLAMEEKKARQRAEREAAQREREAAEAQARQQSGTVKKEKRFFGFEQETMYADEA